MGCCKSKDVVVATADTAAAAAPQHKDEVELDPRDFISEGDEYAAHVRFHKYDEATIAASDVFCYRIELARERLLLLEIKISRVLRKMRGHRADLRMVRQMEEGLVAPVAFGINPATILEGQLAEQEDILHDYIRRADNARRDLDRCYSDIMRFWDVAYAAMLERECAARDAGGARTK